MNRYGAILVDPPWHFNVYSEDTGSGRSPSAHYATMTLTNLKALPMHRLMLPDCAVFMWACFPSLPDALELGAAWGLTYKTCAFLWAKTTARSAGRFGVLTDHANWHMGMGFWTRANTEPCLLFTQGHPKRQSKSVRQLVVSAIRRHSQKPSIHTQIEQLVTGPYCEVFAREQVPGWECIGNEIDGRDIREVLA